jgi:hypothetical protein
MLSPPSIGDPAGKVLGPSTVGFRFLGLPSKYEQEEPSPQTAARTRTSRRVSFIGAAVGESPRKHRHLGPVAAGSKESCRSPTSAAPASAPHMTAAVRRGRQQQESGAWKSGFRRGPLSGAAAVAAHRRLRHPGRTAACSTGCCWRSTAAAPACVPFLYRHRTTRARRRRRQQRQQGSGACAEHKKASAACKLAEAGKIRIS